ncbi:ATP-dependent DNA ligase [Streptomyces flaveolus]|uniref:ATP-dependent DNA ligase n=1 Tax=Streptomyces flaveolus TaxID=67297 RepID=UPI0033E72EAB
MGGPHVHRRDVLDVTLVQPDAVVEVMADVARDAADQWRHPVRLHRTRADASPESVEPFGS